jgi:8-oxo-dGTP pyrophosphatase MutT (NUDIX family)
MEMPELKHDGVIQEIKTVLTNRFRNRLLMTADVTRAAVLVPVFRKNGSYHVLFTRRSETVRHHKGDISFPGGAHDDRDADLQFTALREAFEEIGLQPEDVEILGTLDDVITMSNYLVTPFVARIPYPYPFVPSTDEIAEIIELPLGCFLRQDTLTEDMRTYEEKERRVFVYNFGRYVIWGATAKIMRQFMELLATAKLI